MMSNEEYAYQVLTSNGYTPTEASGIIGNLEQESGLNPELNGSSGLGIAQWLGARRTSAPQPTGNIQQDLASQLDYLMSELNGPYSGTKGQLASATNPSQAADIFEQGYEAAGDPQLGNRENYALQTYADALAGNWPTSGATLTSGFTSAVPGLSGISGSTSLEGIPTKILVAIVAIGLLLIGIHSLIKPNSSPTQVLTEGFGSIPSTGRSVNKRMSQGRTNPNRNGPPIHREGQ